MTVRPQLHASDYRNSDADQQIERLGWPFSVVKPEDPGR
jgi:hypothetical protein